jgi:FkbM family methyltransferase
VAAVDFLRAGHPVVCVEPEPTNFELLQRNLEPYGDSAVAFNAALSDEPTTTLYVSDDPTITAMHVTREKRKYHPIEVACVSMRNLLEWYRPVMVKCDIEGAEYANLSGALLTEFDVSVLVMELHLSTKAYQAAAQVFLEGLEQYGWRFDRPRTMGSYARVITAQR